MTGDYERGKNPKSLSNLKTVPPLPSGVVTRTHRTTGKPAPLEWWGAMTAKQRGQVLDGIYKAREQVNE